MNRIFCYEIRRLLWNRIFFGILLVCLGLAAALLTGNILVGTANTAPFSPWSFGCYLSCLLPVICLGELFFLSFFTSDRERHVRPILQSTPVDPGKYAVVRCAAVIAGTLLLELCVVVLFAGLYTAWFGGLDYVSFILPAVLTLVPPTLLCLGAGQALGRIKPVLVYVLMAVVCLLCTLPLPQAADLSMKSFYSAYPLTLEATDPEFLVPADVLCGRVSYGVIGIVLLVRGRFR